MSDFLHKRREALLAHRTQVDPEGFWMRLPDDVVREVFPWEEFVLARSLVDNGVPEGEPEDDLFAGLRTPPARYLDDEQYLSQEWLDETRGMAARSQPERPGASAQMQYVVSGGPDGDIKYYWILEDGKLLESALGNVAEADFTLTLTYEDSVKVQQGDLDANAAFMQGRMKVAGNMAKLMQLLPLTNSPEYKAPPSRRSARSPPSNPTSPHHLPPPSPAVCRVSGRCRPDSHRRTGRMGRSCGAHGCRWRRRSRRDSSG